MLCLFYRSFKLLPNSRSLITFRGCWFAIPSLNQILSERLYVETLFASLLSYGATTKLLAELLSLDEQLNAVTIRNHLLEVAERSEAELEPEQVSFIEGCPAAWAGLPIPNGPLMIGIDGGFVRDQRDKGARQLV
jgi:hypothetical protein